MDPKTTLLQALALQQEGRFDDAEKLFVEHLRAFPNDVAALYSMGAIEHRRGALRLALGYMARAVMIRPDFEQAVAAKATIEAALAQARISDSTVLECTKPEQREAIRLQAEGRVEEARALFEAILRDDQQDFIASYSMAILFAFDGNAIQALDWLSKSESINPNFSPLYFTRGTLLQSLGLYDEALVAFDRALALKDDNLEALNNKASLLLALDRQYEALQCLLKALSYKPDDPKLLSNVGISFTTLKQHAKAVPYFNRLLQIDRDYDYGAGYRFFAKLHACDWSNYEEHQAEVLEGVAQGKRIVNPMAFCAMSDDPALQLTCARLFAAHRYAVPKEPLWRGERYRHGRLRIGYMSPDFREHPVGHLMAGVIPEHDRKLVEVFGFSLGLNDGSALRKRFKLGFDHFIDCKEKTSQETAALIRACEIDVLIDLAGYTQGSRAEVLAMRPAPVQINYLGYPCTMGADWVDYILADQQVIPPGEERHYQEKVLRLPYCYLPIDDSLKIAERKPTRAEFGLPEKALVFCSFNHDYKINPPMWNVWMALLREHPQSVLWLMKLNDDAMGNLRASALAHDIDPNRLVFATRVPKVEDHLARYQLADVFLDTTPYNAHSTATDVLRAGVPIVTLPGRTFASRVAASVIHHVADKHSVIARDVAHSKEAAMGIATQGKRAAMQVGFPTGKAYASAIEAVVLGL